MALVIKHVTMGGGGAGGGGKKCPKLRDVIYGRPLTPKMNGRSFSIGNYSRFGPEVVCLFNNKVQNCKQTREWNCTEIFSHCIELKLGQ